MFSDYAGNAESSCLIVGAVEMSVTIWMSSVMYDPLETGAPDTQSCSQLVDEREASIRVMWSHRRDQWSEVNRRSGLTG